MFTRFFVAGMMALGVTAVPLPTAAQSPAEFYAGKQLRIIVGSSAGSSYDLYARAFSSYLSAEIPGKPVPVVQNMQGAASVRATNFIYNVAPRDGSLMGTVLREIPLLPLYGESQETLQYDPVKFNWIGSLSKETSVCATWHDSPSKTIQDAMQRETVIGSLGAFDVNAASLNNLVGTRFKIVPGYAGATIELAIERREVDGRCGWSWSTLKGRKHDWLRDKKLNILIQMSAEPDPELKDVPFVLDLARTERDKQALKLIFAPLAFGRPFVMPPDVPKDRVDAVRAAFARAAKNPHLANDFAKQSLEVDLVTGEAMDRLIGDLMQTPPDIVQRAIEAMKKS